MIKEKKLKTKSELSGRLSGAPPTSDNREVKVKLEFGKFNDTHLYWTRFWNQFSVEINSS